MKLCNCGSGKARYDLKDAAGIFCTYVCEDCEDTVRKRYNPDIFRPDSTYALSGEEDDIMPDETEKFFGAIIRAMK